MKVLLIQLCALSTHALSFGSTRRQVLEKTVASTFGGLATSSGWIAAPNAALAADNVGDAPVFSSYQIFPDASATLYPTLKPVAP